MVDFRGRRRCHPNLGVYETNRIFRVSALFAVAVSLAACASTPAPCYSSLASNSYLHVHSGSRSNRRTSTYETQVEWRKYKSFVMDPVEVYNGPGVQFEKISEDDKATLAGHIYKEFSNVPVNRFEPVAEAGDNTVRVRVALTGAMASSSFVATAMKFDLAGGPYNAVQAARGKRGAFTGSVSYAVEIYDAKTDKLLEAYTEKQFPNAMNPKASAGHLDAAIAGVHKGAETLGRSLD